MTKPKRVVLSLGMGVDSSAILLRWLEMTDRQRTFKLDDLIVITAMTGNEFPGTGRLMERYILPELRRYGIRFVQVARAGLKQTAGTTVLSDSRRPTEVFMAGDYRLSDEMITQGTVPQMGKSQARPGKPAGKGRLCSIHAKGWPLDATILELLAGRKFRAGDHLPYSAHTPPSQVPFRHVIGFNADEASRRDRDISYSGTAEWPKRQSWYPLFDWDWGRQPCEDYLAERVGEPWLKSCCFFCPFTKASEMQSMIGRQRDADLDVVALFIEHLSVRLNWRQALYTYPRSLRQYYEKLGFDDSLGELEGEMDELEWALVHLRRLMPAEARSIHILKDGLSRKQAASQLRAQGRKLKVKPTTRRGVERVYLQHRAESFIGQTTEEFLVAIPNEVEEKQKPGFDAMWERKNM